MKLRKLVIPSTSKEREWRILRIGYVHKPIRIRENQIHQQHKKAFEGSPISKRWRLREENGLEEERRETRSPNFGFRFSLL